MKVLRWAFLFVLLLLQSTQGQTGIVAFSASAYTNSASIPVIMTGAPEGDVTVAFRATGAVTTNVTLNFPSGTITNAVSLSLPAAVKTNQIVNLALQNPTGVAMLGSPSNAVLTILGTGGNGGPFPEERQVFPIQLKALLLRDDPDDDEQVQRIGFGHRGLVDGPARLVLIVDAENHTIDLGIVEDDEVTFLTDCMHAAFLVNGQFAAVVVADDLEIFNERIPDGAAGSGAMIIRGSLFTGAGGAARFRRGSVVGVFNDSVNGDSSEPDAVFKGTITPDGPALDTDDLIFLD